MKFTVVDKHALLHNGMDNWNEQVNGHKERTLTGNKAIFLLYQTALGVSPIMINSSVFSSTLK